MSGQILVKRRRGRGTRTLVSVAGSKHYGGERGGEIATGGPAKGAVKRGQRHPPTAFDARLTKWSNNFDRRILTKWSNGSDRPYLTGRSKTRTGRSPRADEHGSAWGLSN